VSFVQCLLSFDDTKVLKEQYDMLMYVQVLRTKTKIQCIKSSFGLEECIQEQLEFKEKLKFWTRL